MATLLLLYFSSALAGLSAEFRKDILILQFSHSQQHLNRPTSVIIFAFRILMHNTEQTRCFFSRVAMCGTISVSSDPDTCHNIHR